MYISTKKDEEKAKYYKKNPRDGKCVFCALDYEEIIEQDKHFVVARNKFSYDIFDMCEVTDHLMIIPTKHIDTLDCMTKVENSKFLSLLIKYELLGYNVYFREPKNLVRTIDHHHTHFIKLGNRVNSVKYKRNPYILEYN